MFFFFFFAKIVVLYMLKFELDLCETCFIDYINLLNSVIYK